jgi:hypothetical protein
VTHQSWTPMPHQPGALAIAGPVPRKQSFIVGLLAWKIHGVG